MYLSDVARRLAEIFDLNQWAEWFASLDRGFIFLLLLPFVVAIVGLWASYFRDDEDKK
jgi:hypothetical protein